MPNTSDCHDWPTETLPQTRSEIESDLIFEFANTVIILERLLVALERLNYISGDVTRAHEGWARGRAIHRRAELASGAVTGKNKAAVLADLSALERVLDGSRYASE